MILIFQPVSASAKAAKPKKIVQVNLATSKAETKKRTKKFKSSSAPVEKKVVALSFAGQGGDVGAEIEPLPQKAAKANGSKNKKKSVSSASKSKGIEIKAKADESVAPGQDPFFHKPEDDRKVASTQKAKPADDIRLYEQFQKATEQEINDDY